MKFQQKINLNHLEFKLLFPLNYSWFLDYHYHKFCYSIYLQELITNLLSFLHLFKLNCKNLSINLDLLVLPKLHRIYCCLYKNKVKNVYLRLFHISKNSQKDLFYPSRILQPVLIWKSFKIYPKLSIKRFECLINLNNFNHFIIFLLNCIQILRLMIIFYSKHIIKILN